MSQEMNKFARPSIDSSEKPPPTAVRYFYASSTSIDDPQATVPPPVAQPSVAPKLPLRPFSDHDNSSLDRVWNELRRNLNKYREEKDAADLKAKRAAASSSPSLKGQIISGRLRGYSLENAREVRRGQNTWAANSTSRDSSSRRGSGSGSGSGGESSKQHASPLPSRLRDSEAYDEADAEEHGLTGRPFARAPSRSKLPWSGRNQSLELDMSRDRQEGEGESLEKTKPVEAPSRTIPVGMSRLHEVTMPNLQYVHQPASQSYNTINNEQDETYLLEPRQRYRCRRASYMVLQRHHASCRGRGR